MICPKCHENILSLLVEEEMIICYEITIDDYGEIEYLEEQSSEMVSGGTNGYFCPRCNERVCHTFEEAKSFLAPCNPKDYPSGNVRRI